jgi:putative phosphoesterase
MRLLILSDIHANLDALESVLMYADKKGYDKIVCLGDVVGYGPNPNETVAWAKREVEKGMIIVKGNHDDDISTDTDVSWYNYDAGNAILIQRNIVTEDNKTFLRNLPLEACDKEYGLHFVHGSPNHWKEYIMMHDDASACFKQIQGEISFIGHTHFPAVWRDMGKLRIINAGSVGQPRDNNPNPCAVLFDTDTKKFEHFRIQYNIKAVQEKMKEQGYTPYLINRLAKGK